MVEREEIEDLLLRYYEGVTTAEETTRVEEWLGASDENSAIGWQIQTIVLAANVAQVSSKLDVKKALTNVHQKMEREKVGSRYQVLFRGMQRAAAILFIPLVVSWCMLYFNNDVQVAEMMEVRTNPGMTTSVVLPDGTEVILNSSSYLQYPSRFSEGERKVKLIGEAFFSVTKDKKPFVVNALSGSEIIVHGTEFNIEAYKENETVQTTLVSGKVSFSYFNKGKRENLMMQPGQKVVYDIAQERVVVKKVNIDVETSWKDGYLIFKNTPFEEVLKRLSKQFNVEFVLKNPALKQESFTATFTKQRLERILENFRISSNIRFKYIDEGNINTERQIIEVY